MRAQGDPDRPGTASLTDFLLARIGEDEATHQEVLDWLEPDSQIEIRLSRSEGNEYRSKRVQPYNPWRAKAECAAKRSIVDLHRLFDNQVVAAQTRDEEQMAVALRDTVGLTLRALATAYADHPDYREEWRP